MEKKSIWKILIKTPPSFSKKSFFDVMKNKWQTRASIRFQKKILFPFRFAVFCSKCFRILLPCSQLIEHSDWFSTKLANNLWHFSIVGFCLPLKWAFYSFQARDVHTQSISSMCYSRKKMYFHYQCKERWSVHDWVGDRKNTKKIITFSVNIITWPVPIFIPFENATTILIFQTEICV